MSNSLIDNSNYINFLYYGTDLVSNFKDTYKISIYKNKYTRLTNYSKEAETYQINTALQLFKTIVSLLKEPTCIHINYEKLNYIDSLFESNTIDRLSFNDIISISFIETELNDEEKWNSIKEEMYLKLHVFKSWIHDDSHNEFKILSIDIPISHYDIKCNAPDIVNYNADIVSQYLSIINNNFDLCKLSYYDNDILKSFSSELKYLLNTGKTLDSSLYGNFFKKYCSKSVIGNNLKLKKFYKKLIPYMYNKNINLLIILQYKLFELIIKSYFSAEIDLKDDGFLPLFLSLDIFICNKALDFNDINTYKSAFTAYNYHIIKLQDLIDSYDDYSDLPKKNFTRMYRSQLFKSRNKIREKINNTEVVGNG